MMVRLLARWAGRDPAGLTEELVRALLEGSPESFPGEGEAGGRV